MPSTKLIGTALDQIPTNGDLGSLAFQDKENVNFTDGRGGLNYLDITKISQQLNVSATAITVYDTSKDSDGGLWRNRCQHLSWYNEELNTLTRGSRREFPSVAVLVGSAAGLTIYDGDDPSLPMWMVFYSSSSAPLENAAPLSIAALNGSIFTASNNNTANSAFGEICLLHDACRLHQGEAINQGRQAWTSSVAGRNSGGSSGSWIYPSPIHIRSSLVNRNTNAVAITALPNAPIDSISQLPVPTIAIGTDTALVVVKEDGSTVKVTTTNWTQVRNVKISGATLYAMQGDYYWMAVDLATVKDLTGIGDRYGSYGGVSPNWRNILPDAQYHYMFNKAADAGTPDTYDFVYAVNDGYYSANNNVVQLISTVPTSPNAGMGANINNRFVSGWQVGDSKYSWLSDTSPGALVEQEIVSDGGFESSAGSWNIQPSATVTRTSISAKTGSWGLTITSSGGSNVYAGLEISGLTIGNVYTASVDVNNLNHNTSVLFNTAIHNTGTTIGGTAGENAATGWQTITTTFIATQSSIFLNVFAQGTIYIDNLSVKVGDADRSINGKGLVVFGQIKKPAVASGSELLAYSPVGSSYLECKHPNVAAVLAGSHTMTFWAYMTGNAAAVWELHGDYGYTMVVYGGIPRIYSYYTPGAGQNSNNWSLPTSIFGRWAHIAITRDSGVWKYYIDGKEHSVVYNNTFQNFSSNSVFAIGKSSYFGYNANEEVSLALFRISATPASSSQIHKMYIDEKALFAENSKCTLYGSSNIITAINFDPDTKHLHVGTSSGRSTFSGMRRIEHSTNPVSAAISAVNGLIAEN